METWLRKEMATMIGERVADAYILPHQGRYRLASFESGRIKERRSLSNEGGRQVIAYFKYRANMAVTEHRRPQSGGISWPTGMGIINLRLSTVGDFAGRESLVIRFIYPVSEDYQLLVPTQWQSLHQLVLNRGLILFAGPLGAGKTTTMYRLAREIKKDQIVMTIEDPVEIEEPWFIQTQVNELAGMSYQELLRVSLRHRPHVLIIGEVRDSMTAKMAIRAGLSGQLVLATVHARSAAGVYSRMNQLGVSEVDLLQAVTGTCYQRLLPLRQGGVAVLFDLAKQCKLSNENVMSTVWHQHLREAVKDGKITQETAKKFAAG
ncbi:MAG: competence type IV pilus ATPase ComGA [Limosilactobacillus gorillae]|uniref:competence type IV pilus ATPase ComGA n=1 Tax=Limosilactobacillus gorillae TaxID=1450649 RepID=UPI000A97CBD7|nr:competence type IV pilus ATPase ComGA [Limosilactobacillus gorillae]MDO4856048.1 competence type IV pilus ATPase ComGA [Limosilactobacillus gorillae]